MVDADALASVGTVPPARVATEQVLQWLDEVMDPEVPVVSVVGLGIVREVVWQYGPDATPQLQIVVTPTYSGCPATEVIAAAIRHKLASHGVAPVEVRTRLSPAWTTDWMSADGRRKLLEYGIAPPGPRPSGGPVALELGYRPALAGTDGTPSPACPLCGSVATEELARFASTSCKSLWRCTDCREPFDHFKEF